MFIAHVATIVAKIGDWVKQHQHDLWVAFCMVFIAWTAYHIGEIRARTPHAITLHDGVVFQAQAKTTPKAPAPLTKRGPVHTDLRVVASKASSSKKYHFSWCSGVARIKEENKIWFQTAQLAEVAGYSLATNCSK